MGSLEFRGKEDKVIPVTVSYRCLGNEEDPKSHTLERQFFIGGKFQDPPEEIPCTIHPGKLAKYSGMRPTVIVP